MMPCFAPVLEACRVILRTDPGNSAVSRLTHKIEGGLSHTEVLQLGQWLGANPCPVRPLLHYALGEYHRANGNLVLALGHLGKADELDKGSWRTKLALGLTCFVLGDYRNALAWFQEANRLGPEVELAPSYEHIAEILARNHREGESGFLPFFQRALELYEQAEDSTGAARCRLRLSETWRWWRAPEDFLKRAADLDVESAHRVLELGFRRHHQNSRLAYRFGQACLQLGQQGQACGCLMRVTFLDDRSWHGPAYELLAATYSRLQLYPQDVLHFYQKAHEAYTAFAEGAAAERCRQKLQTPSVPETDPA